MNRIIGFYTHTTGITLYALTLMFFFYFPVQKAYLNTLMPGDLGFYGFTIFVLLLIALLSLHVGNKHVRLFKSKILYPSLLAPFPIIIIALYLA